MSAACSGHGESARLLEQSADDLNGVEGIGCHFEYVWVDPPPSQAAPPGF
ncbi:MAG: hypothetical protein OXI96_10045 [Acidimicrobiaceae bacterium]|nr:hypothetical protein [Acidimicrobiaceae bacterium]